MSRYTEAQFAATLLSCGPHIRQVRDLDAWQVDGGRYRNHVCRYFHGLFRRPLDTEAEWGVFWTEYLAWVES